MDSDQGPWPVLAGQATAGGTHLPVSCRPQAGRRPRPAETAALSEAALPRRRPDEPENRRGRRDRDQAREPLYRRRPGRGLSPPRPVRRPSALPTPDGSPIRPWLTPNKLARAPTRGDHPGLRPRRNQPTARSFPASSTGQENQIMTAEAHSATAQRDPPRSPVAVAGAHSPHAAPAQRAHRPRPLRTYQNGS